MRTVLSVCLIALLSLTSISATHQDDTPITLSEYWKRVERTQQTVTGLNAETETVRRQKLDELATQWEAVTVLELPDGGMIQIDPSHLTEEFKKDPPDLERLETILNVLLKAHEEYPQDVFTVQDVEPLKSILARPEFQWQTAQTAQSPAWLERILNFIADLMDSLAYGIQNTVYYGRIPLIVAAVIVFLISLYFISQNLSRNLIRDAQLTAENDNDDALLTSVSAMQRAQSLSSQGDHRNAIRYLYLSSLLVLDERGLLRYDRSKTNREYLRSISARPELSSHLGSVIDVFDRVWYGFETVDEDTFQSYTKHVERLRGKE
jgi:hypothetical protein